MIDSSEDTLFKSYFFFLKISGSLNRQRVSGQTHTVVDFIPLFVYQEAASIDNMMKRNSFTDIYCIITE